MNQGSAEKYNQKDVSNQRHLFEGMVITKAGKSQIFRAGHQPGDPDKSQCDSSSLSPVCWQNSLLPRGGHSLFYSDFNWLDETHPQHRGQSAFQSTDLHFNPFQTHPTEASRITLDQVLGHGDLAKQTQQVNHHTGSSILLVSLLTLPSVTLFPFFRGSNNMIYPPDSRSLLFPHFMCLKL